MSVRLVVETEGKGRSFSALVVSRVYAGAAWPDGLTGHGGAHRPVMAVLATTPGEASPLAANLREGRKLRLFGDGMTSKGEKCEFMKSAGYSISTQRCDAGEVLLVRLGDVFAFSPGLLEESVSFVCLPPRARLVEEARRFDNAYAVQIATAMGRLPVKYESEPHTKITTADRPVLGALAALVVAQLAQRVRFPIVGEPAFWTRLFCAMLRDGMARRSTPTGTGQTANYHEIGVAEIGFHPGVCVSTSQAAIGELLERETRAFLSRH